MKKGFSSTQVIFVQYEILLQTTPYVAKLNNRKEVILNYYGLKILVHSQKNYYKT